MCILSALLRQNMKRNLEMKKNINNKLIVCTSRTGTKEAQKKGKARNLIGPSPPTERFSEMKVS
jgi:predicted nucleic acid-binding protein